MKSDKIIDVDYFESKDKQDKSKKDKLTDSTDKIKNFFKLALALILVGYAIYTIVIGMI